MCSISFNIAQDLCVTRRDTRMHQQKVKGPHAPSLIHELSKIFIHLSKRPTP